MNGQYIEVVCALDHPAAEKTPFGQAVAKKAEEGGGWLTWVFSTEDLDPIEKAIGRPAIEGHRRRPDGTELRWKQVGVKELLTDPELPFFIKWQDGNHPSTAGIQVSAISKINFANSNPLEKSALGHETLNSLSNNNITIQVIETDLATRGILSIEFASKSNFVSID